ncbi:MAG: biopolymer transporter ExbD [Verrucomicrobia bacterium]|nr:biopolymer transporter ExbD [Kiritimatiellia bacterium]MCP5487585.1 biopolymer transporter ExbD [Verrucomicrobiota bacterium]
MPRQSSIKPLQEISEINMTPLIDLTFILLITFIITMPLIEQGIPIKLPQGKAQEVNENETRSITLDVEGRLYLDRVPVTLDELRQEMQVIGAAMPNTAILIRADQALAYGKVVEVLRILNEAKIARMALITNPENPAER